MNGTSPAPLPLPKAEIRSVERLSAFLGDADGEDEGVDRESPEHIYQRIDEFDDFDVEIDGKNVAVVVGENVYRAVPAQSAFTSLTSSESKPATSAKVRPEAGDFGGARAYVTTHQPPRVPRQYSLPKGMMKSNLAQVFY